MDNHGKSSIGLEEGTIAAASYFCFLGLIILMVERRSHFVRFHAVQSTLSFGLLAIFWLTVKWISIFHFLVWTPGLIALVFTLYMMRKAADGEEYKLPFVGNLAFSAVYDTDEDMEGDFPAITPPEEEIRVQVDGQKEREPAGIR